MSIWENIARTRHALQGGLCALCAIPVDITARKKGMAGACHAHHINGLAWHDTLANCAVVCLHCHLCKAHKGNYAGHHLMPLAAYHQHGWTIEELANRVRRNPWTPCAGCGYPWMIVLRHG